ncbi:MAG: hypothetical protein K8U03_23375 [Planctomycetia bacterium]|nr:hypothetical protein [Planctomycetia bacterium]
MPSVVFYLGVALVLVGIGLVFFERRGLADPAAGPFARQRSVRRLRIGFQILFLGAAVVAGEAIDPRSHPLAYISDWIGAALIALALLRSATLDYIASRRHWSAELRRSATEMEKARAELRQHLGPDAEAVD